MRQKFSCLRTTSHITHTAAGAHRTLRCLGVRVHTHGRPPPHNTTHRPARVEPQTLAEVAHDLHILSHTSHHNRPLPLQRAQTARDVIWSPTQAPTHVYPLPPPAPRSTHPVAEKAVDGHTHITCVRLLHVDHPNQPLLLIVSRLEGQPARQDHSARHELPLAHQHAMWNAHNAHIRLFCDDHERHITINRDSAGAHLVTLSAVASPPMALSQDPASVNTLTHSVLSFVVLVEPTRRRHQVPSAQETTSTPHNRAHNTFRIDRGARIAWGPGLWGT